MKNKISLQEMINILNEQLIIEMQNVNERKDNISKNYMMAKHDFRCIKNMEDVCETYEDIIETLKDCQKRIIERNSINIKML